MTPIETYWIDGDEYMIGATSCTCGGQWAWLRRRPSGAWEMVGCICHTLPTQLKKEQSPDLTAINI